MKLLTPTFIEDILERAAQIEKIYDALTPEQKAEVDAYNQRLIAAAESGDPKQVAALPVNPMLAYIDAAEDTAMHLGQKL